jgi:prolyl oligopeptidase
VLATVGLNDPRVLPWHPSKMVARLQQSSSSGYPIVLRVERDGGHGIGATREQTEAELADRIAFLLKYLS